MMGPDDPESAAPIFATGCGTESNITTSSNDNKQSASLYKSIEDLYYEADLVCKKVFLS